MHQAATMCLMARRPSCRQGKVHSNAKQPRLMYALKWTEKEVIQRLRRANADVRFGSLADIGGLIGDVRFAPKSGRVPRPNPRHKAAQAWDFLIL